MRQSAVFFVLISASLGDSRDSANTHPPCMVSISALRITSRIGYKTKVMQESKQQNVIKRSPITFAAASFSSNCYTMIIVDQQSNIQTTIHLYIYLLPVIGWINRSTKLRKSFSNSSTWNAFSGGIGIIIILEIEPQNPFVIICMPLRYWPCPAEVNDFQGW